jgi:hypothetical protein
MNNPNSFDAEVQDATANPESSDEGTEQMETVETPTSQGIDYEVKFKESAREAQRLYEEKKALEAKLTALSSQERQELTNNPSTDVTELFPGFEHLDEDAQRNLLAYTSAVKKQALQEVYNDPDIAYVKTEAKEKRWNSAFDEVAQELPELREHSIDFRAKYYNPNTAVDPVVLKELAKSFLFDKAKDIGAREAQERANRVNLEDIGGGDKTPATSSRTLEEWNRLAQENPAKFASMSKQFNEDLAKMK